MWHRPGHDSPADDVSEEQLIRIFADTPSLAWKWRKPQSARLQPVKGKKAGDRTEFNDPFLLTTIRAALIRRTSA